MALHSDVYEPKSILNILKTVEKSSSFESDWKGKVQRRVESWKKTDDNKSTPTFQLEWEAEVVEYVNYLNGKLVVHKNSSAESTPKTLNSRIPLLGPRFVPPHFLHYLHRSAEPLIKPEYAYISPITIIHPVFYPTFLSNCPRCLSTNIRWDSWNGTGARHVYGVRINERALGRQLRCNTCQEEGRKYCLVSTNQVFWEKWEHWKIPRSVPHFSWRAAVTHELFDLIVELRPSSTSAGLSENLKQLHLLEYKQRMLEYLAYFEAARKPLFGRKVLLNFSAPTDEQGYNDSYITHEFVTDMYKDFIVNTRESESTEYCKTRTAKSVSMDNTFKSAAKATIVEKGGRRVNPMKGGILSAINEYNEGLGWRLCLSNSAAETSELLATLGRRHDALGIERPLSVIVDNCCQVRQHGIAGLGSKTLVLLDVHHFMMRYSAAIYGGVKNPHRSEVLCDIRNAIIKTPAEVNRPATYWAQPEQEKQLVDAYNKWDQRGSVWSAAAAKIHGDQLRHVQKGCLARPREDICMDGSRIEGSHKAWNSLQRAQSSGLDVYTGLGHDHFLRRNIRIASSRIKNEHFVNNSDFIASAYTSHHVQLVNYAAETFNRLYDEQPVSARARLEVYPTLPKVPVVEKNGLVESGHSVTFGGLVSDELKYEEESKEDEADIFLRELDAVASEMDETAFIQSLGVEDERQFSEVQPPSLPPLDSTPSTTALVLNTPTSPFQPPQKRKEHPEGLAVVSHSEKVHCLDVDEPVSDSKRRRIDPIGLNDASSESEILAENNPLDDFGVSELADSVEVVAANIALPSTSSTNSIAHAFFKFKAPNASMLSDSSQASKAPKTAARVQMPGPLGNSLNALRRPLPLPKSLRDKGLTPSQLLFAVGTSIDPRALRILGDDEFFLFMDMRIEFQWTTFGMTASKWATAAKIYNDRLESELKKKPGINFIRKSPRALADKLAEVEPKISDRLHRKDFYSAGPSRSETFWKKHCYAVTAIVKTDTDGAQGSSAGGELEAGRRTRKLPACQRCKASNRNHKKGVCGDGVAAKPKAESKEASLPEWPQPEGIFKDGKFFDPSKFLCKVRELYEKVLEHATQGAIRVDDDSPAAVNDYLSLEDQAFSLMFASRTIVVDGHSFFQLHSDFEVAGSVCESLISEVQGTRCLRIDCLELA